MFTEQEPAKNQTVAPRHEMTHEEFERILEFASNQAPHRDAMNRYDKERHAKEIAAVMRSGGFAESFARQYAADFSESFAEGIAEVRHKIIPRIHAAGYSVAWIANALDLPIEDVEQLVRKSSS